MMNKTSLIAIALLVFMGLFPSVCRLCMVGSRYLPFLVFAVRGYFLKTSF